MIPKRWRIAQVLYVALDLAFLVAADLLGLVIRFEGAIPKEQLVSCMRVWPITLPARMLVLAAFGMYQRLWKYASVRDLMATTAAVTLGYIVTGVIAKIWPNLGWSRGAALVSFLLAMCFIGMSRFYMRLMAEVSPSTCANGNGNGQADGSDSQPEVAASKEPSRVLIVGAGSAGVMVAKELASHPEMERRAIGFVDDDPGKRGCVLYSLPVLGSRRDIAKLVSSEGVDEIIIAMPSAGGSVTREVMETCKALKHVKIRTLPGMYELVDGKVSLKQLRDIQIEDLLGREPVKLDMNRIGAYLGGQRVMVTGAGGSIGSEICRQVARFKPEYIILLGHGENSIFEIEQDLRHKYPELKTIPVIADVRDRERISRVFETYRPGVVFHAAAHKHVPLMEANPQEALTNNVFGTKNVAEAADKYGAKRFVMISTDKAVNPVSIMGMSKRGAEMVVQAVGSNSKTKFMAVRFGNVLGSRGSVVPTFRKQIAEGGPVTVTDPRMTRYFMTIPEAVQLVIQAGSMGKGGEIFVLDMGEPVKIVDLAEQIISLSGMEPGVDIEIEYTGIRPGEKLYEEILTSDELTVATRHSKIFVSKDRPADAVKVLAAVEGLYDRRMSMSPQEAVNALESVSHACWDKSEENARPPSMEAVASSAT